MSISLFFTFLLLIILILGIFLPFYNIFKIFLTELTVFVIYIFITIFDYYVLNMKLTSFFVSLNRDVIFKFISENIQITKHDLFLGMNGITILITFVCLYLVFYLIYSNSKITTGNFVFKKNIYKEISIRTLFVINSFLIITLCFSLLSNIIFINVGYCSPLFDLVNNIGVFKNV